MIDLLVATDPRYRAISARVHRRRALVLRLLLRKLRRAATRRWAAWRLAHRRRRSIAALRALDDRTLGDIGVGRGNISATVNDHLAGVHPRCDMARRPATAPVARPDTAPRSPADAPIVLRPAHRDPRRRSAAAPATERLPGAVRGAHGRPRQASAG
jgi:uncharacterized protein YjiS (DUF1127 family)